MSALKSSVFAAALTVAAAASGTAIADAPAPPALPQPGPGSVIAPALFVTDVARSVKFYAALGLKIGMQKGPPQQLETILTFGGDPRSAGIILMSDTSTAPIEHGRGYDRLVLRIGDLTALAARLKAAGFTSGAIHDAGFGYRVMPAVDPDGYKLELVEAHPRVQG